MSSKNSFVQSVYSKLSVLIAFHFLADFFVCLLPGFFPVILKYFNLPLTSGVIVVTFIGIGANLMQVPLSMLGEKSEKPNILSLGLVLASLVIFIGLFPRTTPIWVLLILMLLIGCGCALVHPHGLRGVQALSGIAPTISTPVFMTGGFTGAAFAPWIGALLVGNQDPDLSRLIWLVIPTALVIAGGYLTGIRLSVARKDANTADGSTEDRSPWDFCHLFVIAALMNTGTVTLQYLLPTFLHGIGYNLSFGGFSLMLFGAGSAIGSMALGTFIRNRPAAPFVLSGFAAGIALLILYFIFPGTKWSSLLICCVGLLVSAQYPLLVAFARIVANTKVSLSLRLAYIVGATWGLANILFMGIGQLERWIGVSGVMHFTEIFYAAALIYALLTLRKKKV